MKKKREEWSPLFVYRIDHVPTYGHCFKSEIDCVTPSYYTVFGSI